MKKEKDYFKPYIEAKQSMIFQVRCNKHFSDSEKEKLITEYKKDIDCLRRLETCLAVKELKKSKERQSVFLRNYETLFAPLLIIVMMFCSCNTSYPVYAKKVHINDSSVVVDNGYWIHHRNYYEVNGKKYYWAKFKKTNNPDYISHR